MAMSKERQEEFLRKMAESLKKNQSAADSVVEKEKVVAKDLFANVDIPDCDKNQVMFSELFFDPSEIGMPDFPVDTFHHMHDEWPEWIRSLVPEKDKNYQWNKEVVYSFVSSDDEHAFLVGLPGSGKTTLPEQVGAVTGRPVFKQSFQNDLEADEWLMSKEIDDTGTRWHVLPFVKCLDYPVITILDEFNRLRRGGRLLMNPLLDVDGALQLRDGTAVKPHPKWRAVATDNTKGMGDGLDKFDGDIADISTTDRFGLMIEVEYLPKEQQVGLLKSWYPELDDDVAQMIVSFGERIITGYKTNVFPLPWTPRRMRKAGKFALRYRNVTKALRDCYFNFLAEDDERQACNQVLKDLGIASKFGEFV